MGRDAFNQQSLPRGLEGCECESEVVPAARTPSPQVYRGSSGEVKSQDRRQAVGPPGDAAVESEHAGGWRMGQLRALGYYSARVFLDRETELLCASHLNRLPCWDPIEESDVRWCHCLLMLKHSLDLSENNMALRCLP